MRPGRELEPAHPLRQDSRARERRAGPARLDREAVEGVALRVAKVFAGLDGLDFLGTEERSEFRYYERLFAEALKAIEAKAASGKLRPLSSLAPPPRKGASRQEIRVGIFIGSFDPFQMTHLALALGFLASPESEADLVFVVPEGSENPLKPHKSEYRFRFELMRAQLEEVFSPLVLPLDLGEGADTIGIVERLISRYAGSRLKLSHLLGSDALPTAVLLLPEDLGVWQEAARLAGVELDHGLFVIKRQGGEDIGPYAEAVRQLGLRFSVEERCIQAPSSTDFRRDRALTIAFPTKAVLARLELLFRYGMNRPWMSPEAPKAPEEPEPPEYFL